MQTLFWVNAPKQMKTATYIFLGWAVLPYAGEMRTALGGMVRLVASTIPRP
jgi:predicted membrane channel-forming protein YqfA (hemolysin III family)